MPPSRVAVVTGGNKGIGYAIDYPHSAFNTGKFVIYLTARSKERGEKAVQDILADRVLKKAAVLTAAGGPAKIQFQRLDIEDSRSISAFSEYLRKEHPDGIDVAINNAGVGADGFGPSAVRSVLQVNYYGTLLMSQTFLEHLRPGGRLVNIASLLGRINQYPSNLQDALRHAASQSKPDATTRLMEEFADSVASNTIFQSGWPRSAYSVSKAGCIAMTKALANDEKTKGNNILVNACCPGYIKTDLTKHRGFGTPEQGARTPALLALGDINGASGEFWKGGKVTDW